MQSLFCKHNNVQKISTKLKLFCPAYACVGQSLIAARLISNRAGHSRQLLRQSDPCFKANIFIFVVAMTVHTLWQLSLDTPELKIIYFFCILQYRSLNTLARCCCRDAKKCEAAMIFTCTKNCAAMIAPLVVMMVMMMMMIGVWPIIAMTG